MTQEQQGEDSAMRLDKQRSAQRARVRAEKVPACLAAVSVVRDGTISKP